MAVYTHVRTQSCVTAILNILSRTAGGSMKHADSAGYTAISQRKIHYWNTCSRPPKKLVGVCVGTEFCPKILSVRCRGSLECKLATQQASPAHQTRKLYYGTHLEVQPNTNLSTPFYFSFSPENIVSIMKIFETPVLNIRPTFLHSRECRVLNIMLSFDDLNAMAIHLDFRRERSLSQ